MSEHCKMVLTLTRRALRDLRFLPAADRRRMMERLESYAAAPDATGHDVIPLKGTPSGFRLRTGDWRALFTVSGDEMTVYRIGHRREVYR
jgi:mRNA interferase RelE/StbE